MLVLHQDAQGVGKGGLKSEILCVERAVFGGPRAGSAESSTAGRGAILDLPCDWRFLPKLGPLRFGARAFSFLYSQVAPIVTVFCAELRIFS
jgi:hypothetical protein